MKKNVFISYSSKESSTAHMISDVLEKNGISCWIAPESIAPGLDYSEEIPRGIEGCDVFLLLLSESSQASVWVKNELLTAVSAGKIVIPFVISKCDITKAFQFALTSTQRWDAYESMSENLEKLVKQIKGIAGLEEAEEIELYKETEEKSFVKLLQTIDNEEVEVIMSGTVEEQGCVVSGGQTEIIKEFEGILYIDDGKEITVVGCEKGTEHVSIPKEIEGMIVTQIGDSAFEDCKNLEKVTIEGKIKRIGNRAFAYCENLWELHMPEEIEEVGEDVFKGCTSIYEENIPWSVLLDVRYEIKTKSFEQIEYRDDGRTITIVNCSEHAEEVFIPEEIDGMRVIKIGGGAFRYRERLKKIELPKGLLEIGSEAFNGCLGLIEIKIPQDVTRIGEMAFCNCKNLKDIIIPEGITRIESLAFMGCESIEELEVPENVIEIGCGAFFGCLALTKINIPQGVTKIDAVTFSGCSSLMEIANMERVTEIGYAAFSRCKSLEKIAIPEGVTEMGRSAFRECKSLKKIVVPEGVKTIEDEVFESCGSLREIVIRQ